MFLHPRLMLDPFPDRYPGGVPLPPTVTLHLTPYGRLALDRMGIVFLP